MMRVVEFDRYGPPEVLTLVERPVPVAGPGEVLVRVRACAVNSHDLLIREGLYRANRRFPHVLGGDVAGEVVSYGPDCQNTVPIGAAVMLYWQRACGRCESCERGRRTTCLNYEYLGAQSDGGYADYVVVPEEHLVPIDEPREWADAAAFPQAFGTAWRMVVTKGQAAPGELVLIQGASTGVGLAAVQIARLCGAEVIATAGSDDKLRAIADLGADHLINYQTQDLRREIARITGKRGVDLVVDSMGGPLWGDMIHSVTRQGRVVVCGGSGGWDLTMHAIQVFERELTILGSNGSTPYELRQVVEHYTTGRLRSVVDEVLDLDQAAVGHLLLAERARMGKVVLRT